MNFRYIVKAGTEDGGAGAGSAAGSLFGRVTAMLRGRKLTSEPISVRGVDDAMLEQTAKETIGFSGMNVHFLSSHLKNSIVLAAWMICVSLITTKKNLHFLC
jgi:hypothetical protein